MIRKHENSVSWKAGTLAVAVHVVLLGALLISFNWKAAHTVLKVTEVDLWDKLPAQSAPKVVPKPEPKPEPKAEEKPKPEEPKADIELAKKKQKLAEKELEDKRKKDEERKKIAAAMRDEDLQDNPKKDNNALKKIQEELRNEEKGDSEKQASAANASLIGEYTDKIRAKIRGNVNKTLCGDGNLELRFEIGLLPTGELSGTPKITKSNGSTACNDAVERAIIASEPLPLPSDPNLFSSFRNLNLKFRPNDN